MANDAGRAYSRPPACPGGGLEAKGPAPVMDGSGPERGGAPSGTDGGGAPSAPGWPAGGRGGAPSGTDGGGAPNGTDGGGDGVDLHPLRHLALVQL
ncbi:MAG TPA: hypothetical protein PKU97_24985, partial [Kofleriaceae bacterium]|nr:hypothetical protein [Kofleriaceae bacterium]